MDSYRPRGDNRPDSYRPGRRDNAPPPRPPRDAENGMYYFQGSRDSGPRNHTSYRPRPRQPNGRIDPPRRETNRRPPPLLQKTAAERPLFRLTHNEADNQSFPDSAAESRFKFRNVDELTDSDEEAMAQSEEEEDDDQRITKRARIDHRPNPGPAVPKWSNPDPYTALPPPADSTAKRTDVVKLIRKARIDAARNLESATDAEDFISFDVDENASQADSTPPAVGHTPSVSRFAFTALPPRPFPLAIPPPPSLPATPIPNIPTAPTALTEGKVLGKRKRGASVGEKPWEPRSDNTIYADRTVETRWAATAGINSTPWLTAYPVTDNAGIALHKEIIDFYEWVKPKHHEDHVRGEVFHRLSSELRRVVPGALKAFGSYAAGLYLPTADMDLVYLTPSFKPGRPAKKHEVRELLPLFASHLRKHQVARSKSLVVISGAKVPIIKFTDNISGLKVDLSFDNDTGTVAIDTFHKWKQAYPIMPIIVSVVKQYLMIRGLNDVSTGGLGGFSTICLVTSLLQHMPATQQPMNLGQVLLEFFNYYGNLFDKDSVIIRLEPPAYLDKASYRPPFKDKESRLTIIDPHRSDNNISGGTSQIDLILNCFSKAHRALLNRLSEYEGGDPHDRPSSFLECLIGGNFTAYDSQRQHLYRLATPRWGAGKGSTVPIPKSTASQRGETNDSNGVSGVSARNPPPLAKASAKDEKRASRLKMLRPDLAPSIQKSISLANALRLGGYATADIMEKDLQMRGLVATKTTAAKVGGHEEPSCW